MTRAAERPTVSTTAGPLPAQPRRSAAADPLTRALEAGIRAVWTGNCSGTVELSRLSGPRDGEITPTDCGSVRLPGRPPWRLSSARVKAALYEHCLTRGTQFEIYRWVNLDDLAAIWHLLDLPGGVRNEWARVLRAAGLTVSEAN